MTKQSKKLDRIWVVVSDDGFEGSYNTYNLAREAGEDLCENQSKREIKIMEVVKAWIVEYPDDPSPETYETALANV